MYRDARSIFGRIAGQLDKNLANPEAVNESTKALLAMQPEQPKQQGFMGMQQGDQFGSAATGAMTGASMGGPWGALVGAAIGNEYGRGDALDEKWLMKHATGEYALEDLKKLTKGIFG